MEPAAVDDLPGEAGEALRCAEWTRDQGVDPVGTAGHHHLVLLVETPPPWPQDVSEVADLAGVAGVDPSVRVLAVLPREDDDLGLVRVVRWRRDPTGAFRGLDHRVDRREVPRLLRALVDDPEAEHPGLVGESPPDVLLCAHGRRDRCCGRGGTLLSVEVAARWPGVRVWRCSHTGGHRFAPTGITFPDGRAWAHLDAELLDGVLDRTIGWDRLRPHHRGSLALDPWAQAAEGALLERLGWGWLDHGALVASSVPHADGRGADVTLSWAGPGAAGPHADDAASGRAEARVRVVRDVPVIACGAPLAAVTKSSPELEVTSLTIA